jgi:hypothetical protein
MCQHPGPPRPPCPARLLPPLQGDWLKLGFIMSIWYLTIWLGVGGAWWKVIGLW